jgi:hypothetical protein
VYEKLVEAGRSELMGLVADTRAPDDEIDEMLRRLAASLLADMPRDGAGGNGTAVESAQAGVDAG